MTLELARRGRARSACALSPGGFFSSGEIRSGPWHPVVDRAADAGAGVVCGRGVRPPGTAPAADEPVHGPPRAPAAAPRPRRCVRAMAGAPWFDDTLRTITAWVRDPAPDPAVPVTIGWGEKDRLLFPRQGRRAVEAIPSATLVPLIGCGHLPTFDDPQQVADLMLATTAAAPPDSPATKVGEKPTGRSKLQAPRAHTGRLTGGSAGASGCAPRLGRDGAQAARAARRPNRRRGPAPASGRPRPAAARTPRTRSPSVTG